MKNPLKAEFGLSLIECIIALLLSAVAIISLVEMQSLAWRGAGKSDYLGRAQAILQRELETCEYKILRGNNIPDDTRWMDQYGNEVQEGDANATFEVQFKQTTPATIPANTRLLNVRVKWPGSKTGISSSIIVLPHSDY